MHLSADDADDNSQVYLWRLPSAAHEVGFGLIGGKKLRIQDSRRWGEDTNRRNSRREVPKLISKPIPRPVAFK